MTAAHPERSVWASA